MFGHDVLGGHSVSPRKTKEATQVAQVSYTLGTSCPRKPLPASGKSLKLQHN